MPRVAEARFRMRRKSKAKELQYTPDVIQHVLGMVSDECGNTASHESDVIQHVFDIVSDVAPNDHLETRVNHTNNVKGTAVAKAHARHMACE